MPRRPGGLSVILTLTAMTYAEAIDFLYNSLPMFQDVGAGAYKPGLEGVLRLSEAFGNPHSQLRCIHVAGTNGKGSTSSLIAATLTASGHRTGLYTSPHLLDFRERMRIDGEMITEHEVTDFVERYRAMELPLSPSFFELTTVMAFEWFARHGVDYAVIEVGLGGRLDSTNIITPLVSVITNISLDHTALLGDTPAQIAREKAGIIKPGVPVVIGEAQGDVRKVFEETACDAGAPIQFVQDELPYVSAAHTGRTIDYFPTPFGDTLSCTLTGECQPANAATTMTVLRLLRDDMGVEIPDEAAAKGFAEVAQLSGLAGRWMRLSEHPLTICDTGHNTGGWQYLSRQLAALASSHTLHMVIGFVNDKDVSGILAMMPRDARYYFTQASVRRALPADELAESARRAGLKGEAYATVADAYHAAREAAGENGAVFVGGSTFVVADQLALAVRRPDGTYTLDTQLQ